MAKKEDDKPTKITTMFKVGYAFAAPDGKLRTGALLIRAATSLDAQIAARRQLSAEFDWFKLTKTITYEGDAPQQAF